MKILVMLIMCFQIILENDNNFFNGPWWVGVTWNSTENLQYSWMFPISMHKNNKNANTNIYFSTQVNNSFYSLRPSDTHMSKHKLNIIGSDNGLSPGQRQAIISTKAGILLIWPFIGTNVSEMLIKIHTSSKKFIWKCRLQNSGHFVWASMC